MKKYITAPGSEDTFYGTLNHDTKEAAKKAIHVVSLKADAVAILLIMLGGIIAVISETRVFGVTVAVAGFTMLFLRLEEKF